MAFRAMVDQPAMAKGAAVCIQDVDRPAAPPLVLFRAGDLLDVEFQGKRIPPNISARVTMMHEQHVVLELADESRWLLRRVHGTRHKGLEIGAGANASLWDVQGPAARPASL